MAHPTQSAAVVVSEDWSKPSVAKESHPVLRTGKIGGKIGGQTYTFHIFP